MPTLRSMKNVADGVGHAERSAQPLSLTAKSIIPEQQFVPDDHDAWLFLAVRIVRAGGTLQRFYDEKHGGPQPLQKYHCDMHMDDESEANLAQRISRLDGSTAAATWTRAMRIAFANIYLAETAAARKQFVRSSELLSQAMYWIGVIAGGMDARGLPSAITEDLDAPHTPEEIQELSAKWKSMMDGASRGGKTAAITKRKDAVNPESVRKAAEFYGWPETELKGDDRAALALRFNRTSTRIGQILRALKTQASK